MHCLLKFVGQTDRLFCGTYKERAQAIKRNDSNAGYQNTIFSKEHIMGYKERNEHHKKNTTD
jgi:phage replication-related protein YjqB (UPF0714/DUF867 family)